MDPLRTELAERSPCEAPSCPSWASYVGWLQAKGHAEIGEWLALTLAGSRRKGDRQQLRRLVQRVLAARDGVVEQLWRGELGWSLWFGPFMLAYVGPRSPDLPQLRAALGPHAMLLTDERAWIDGDRKRLSELEPGVPLLLTRTLPGAQQPICEQLLTELREQVGARAIDGRQLEWRGRGFWRILPAEAPDGRAIVSLGSGETLRALHWDRMRALEAVAVVGPPELLSRWPDQPGQADQARTLPLFSPLPNFERRYQQLGAARPDLFAQLRAELDARSIEQAHTCPSWLVYCDWLLDQGHELLAEWLRIELEQRDRGQPLPPRNRRNFTTALAPVRPSEAAALRRLWGEQDAEGAQARSIWLGPFMLAYTDPQVLDGLGADELQAILGPHAAFLPRARVHTRIDWRWIERAMTRGGSPVLAPTPPNSTELFGMVLLELHEDEVHREELARRMRMATPGQAMEEYAERSFATNVGPIAADREAIAVICCETEADVRRHAADWQHLQTFEHVVLLGTPEVLARWPHAGEWIEPWGAGLS